MTGHLKDAIVKAEKTEPRVRKGKAMLKIHTFSAGNTYSPFDLQGIIMPAAKKAEWLINVCLFKAGPSGYLDPGAPARIPE